MAHLRDGRPAQAVIATELNDDDRRLVFLQQGGQALQRARCGLSADTGIDNGESGVRIRNLSRH